MAIVGIIYAMFNGTMDEVNKAIFESADEAVTLSIGLISILVFWLGIMKIAEEAGILRVLAKLLTSDCSKNYFQKFRKIIQQWVIFYPILLQIYLV